MNDYYSAGIKAEVVLDTMMTPVIADLLKEQISFSGEPVYITKEFPLKTATIDHRNRKADYVLMDNKSIYLVELKTSMGSIDKEQLNAYGEKLEKYDGKKLLDEFTELLKSIYGINDEENSDLVSVTDRIVKSLTDSRTGFSDWVSSLSKSDPQEEQRERPEQYIRTLMKNKKIKSSQKFLFQAARIVTNSSMSDWGSKDIKLIYMMPCKSRSKILEDFMDGREAQVQYFYFDKIRSGSKGDNAGEMLYIDWLKEKILIPLFLA
ncbi:MAG: hypothetical protein K6G19_08265 [Lachnospiraceae bacterium]|nr:hypothetical protein [Lachnospiraceae bacterium]